MCVTNLMQLVLAMGSSIHCTSRTYDVSLLSIRYQHGIRMKWNIEIEVAGSDCDCILVFTALGILDSKVRAFNSRDCDLGLVRFPQTILSSSLRLYKL